MGNKFNDCAENHWEKLKRLVSLEAKQRETTMNRTMRVIMNTPSHSSRGGEVGQQED
jgi:hypothetical protein